MFTLGRYRGIGPVFTQTKLANFKGTKSLTFDIFFVNLVLNAELIILFVPLKHVETPVNSTHRPPRS